MSKYTPETCILPKPTIKINHLNDVNIYYDKWLKENKLETVQDIDIEELHNILGDIHNRDDFFDNIKCADNEKFLDINCNNGIFNPKCIKRRLKGGKKIKYIKHKKNLTKKKIKNNYKTLIRQKQKGKLTKKKAKVLDKMLQNKLCKCIKGLKAKNYKNKKFKKGSEYPICLSSIYTKRGIKPPKRAIKKCKK